MIDRHPPPIRDFTDLEGEEWRPVPGYEGAYEVSNCGRVKSLGTSRNHPPRMLRQTTKLHGYRFIALYRSGERKCPMIHRLVLSAFVGPCPEGREGCHADGDPANNHISNLYWGTRLENIQDMVRHGKRRRNKTHCAQGHPFDEANTILFGGGMRRCCRVCVKAQNDKQHAKQKAERARGRNSRDRVGVA